MGHHGAGSFIRGTTPKKKMGGKSRLAKSPEHKREGGRKKGPPKGKGASMGLDGASDIIDLEPGSKGGRD